jgi:hypothetical protein
MRGGQSASIELPSRAWQCARHQGGNGGVLAMATSSNEAVADAQRDLLNSIGNK